MTGTQLPHARWHKASYSSANSNCVEIARPAHAVGVRDSKAPDAGQLLVSAADFDAARRALRARS